MEPVPSLGLTHQKFSKILYARKLRKRMTVAEKLLWNALRNRQLKNIKFRRQVPLGQFVADFCSMEHRFIVEVEGGIHEEKKEYDLYRKDRLKEAGFRLLQITNQEIMTDLSSVLAKIGFAIIKETFTT